MPDEPFAPIVLDPNTNAVSGPMTGLPPMPPLPQSVAPSQSTLPPQAAALSQSQPQPVQTMPAPAPVAALAQAVPLQPIPRADMSQPQQPNLPDRQAQLHQQLDTLSQEENKLLGTIKDWVAWIQGAETKKQALERELQAIDKQFQTSGGNVPTQATTPTATSSDRATIEKHLREAQAQLKTVQDQQKIEEKKAFDNYSAGGINREGLLKEMERINTFYTTPLTTAKAKITTVQQMLNPAAVPTGVPVTMPVAGVAPVSSVTTPSAPASSAPAAVATFMPPTSTPTPQAQKILDHLRALPIAQTGFIKQLLIDLPAQGTALTVERAADGNGVIILAGTEQAYTTGHHFPDADLILSGLGADDIVALPTGTLTGSQITPPGQVGL